MNQQEILQKIERNELNAVDAYKELYPQKKSKMGKRAYFVKMRISIPEEGRGINTFLRILFALPIPIMFARMGLRFSNRFVKDDNVDLDQISKMLKYSKNSMISVESSDAIVDIKVM